MTKSAASDVTDRSGRDPAHAGDHGKAATGGGTKYAAPALEKGLEILELLADQPDGLTQTEIAQALGRSISEIFRMIATLQRWGYITFAPESDRYTLTLKLFELSHRHPPMQRLIAEAMPLMRAIAHETEQSSHLVFFDRHEQRILAVAQVDAPGPLGFAVRMGAVIDLYRTSSGLVFLAFASESERRSLLQAARQALSPREFQDLEMLIDEVQRRGFAEMDSQQVRGVRSISFPVRDFQGEPIAALAIPFLERLDRPNAPGLAAARSALERAAGTLSARLGYDIQREGPHRARGQG